MEALLGTLITVRLGFCYFFQQLVYVNGGGRGFCQSVVGPRFRSDHSVLAVSFRDHPGSLCYSYTEHSPTSVALVLKTRALILAVKIVRAKNWYYKMFESDCQLLCNDVLDNSLSPSWSIYDAVLELGSFFSQSSYCSFTLDFWEAKHFDSSIGQLGLSAPIVWSGRSCFVTSFYPAL